MASRGFLFGMADRDEESSFNKRVDEAWMMNTVERLINRAPAFERLCSSEPADDQAQPRE